ncbi:hypothetical protein PISL3812_04167 [Talaromyces islandicus]|uniref:AA1-like domain-containing protein n=1 Tax=Talaromyces islandicus TaxID=28573 RepID=A0A0U1LWW8_TALIS|nr:hypothetical protein PISL3812_04167 [Talaromyces islandicus]
MRFLPILAVSLGNVLFASAYWKRATYYHDNNCDEGDFAAQYFEYDPGSDGVYCFNVTARAPVHSIYDLDVGGDPHTPGSSYYSSVSFDEPGCKGQSSTGNSQCVTADSKNETFAIKSWQNVYHAGSS